MTRKDYILLANATKNYQDNLSLIERTILKNYVESVICDCLEVDNERFDRKKFLNACGFDLTNN